MCVSSIFLYNIELCVPEWSPFVSSRSSTSIRHCGRGQYFTNGVTETEHQTAAQNFHSGKVVVTTGNDDLFLCREPTHVARKSLTRVLDRSAVLSLHFLSKERLRINELIVAELPTVTVLTTKYDDVQSINTSNT